jgi:hypothetical protein
LNYHPYTNLYNRLETKGLGKIGTNLDPLYHEIILQSSHLEKKQGREERIKEGKIMM